MTQNKEYDYFANCVSYHGEMLPLERYTLYSWIKKYKPSNILEIGTGTGGSTQYISDAAQENGFGKIYSCDPTRSPRQDFIQSRNNLEFHQTISSTMIQHLIDNQINIDFMFFDGPEDPNTALNDLIKLETYIKPGTLFCMHDWHIGVRGYDSSISTKANNIKPYIEKSVNWTEIEILYGDKKNSNFDSLLYDSVGLCLYSYKAI
jgi:predicted O-methyltransferase YrrM